MIERRKDSHGKVLKDGEKQRANGTYSFRKQVNGKRMEVYAPTLNELRVKERNLLDQIHSGVYSNTAKITINDVYERWKSVKSGIKKNSMDNYTYMYDRYVKNDFGKNRIADVKKSDVKLFYKRLFENGLQVGSIDNIHSCLHQVLNVAVDDELIAKNPADGALGDLKKFANKPEQRVALTKQQEESLLSFIENDAYHKQYYPVFLFMLNTGLRVGELSALQQSDIDLTNKIVTINKTLVDRRANRVDGALKTVYEINTPKTEKGNRIVPLYPNALKAVQMQKDFMQDNCIACNEEYGGLKDFMFINDEGRILKGTTLNKALRSIVKKCNRHLSSIGSDVVIPHISCHNMRHTFATRLNESGLNTKYIQSVLGHKDIETTQDIYISFTSDLMKQETERFIQIQNQRVEY